ncbi:hypothetical protein Bca4012_058625 [Brassica carinata]
MEETALVIHVSVSRVPGFLDLRRKPPPFPSKPLPLLFSTGAAKTCVIDETRLWSEVPESSHRMLLMIPELQTLFSIMEFLLPNSSNMECSLHIYSSAMEFLLIGCRLTTRLWFQVSSISSAIECLMLNCRTFSWMWLQRLFIDTFVKHISIFFNYHGFCTVALVLHDQFMVWKIGLMMMN